MKIRHPRHLSVEDAHLVVIDIQGKLFDLMSEPGKSQMQKNTAILLAAAEELNVPVTTTVQYPKGLGQTIESLAEAVGKSPIIEKIDFAATEVTAFTSRLAGQKRSQIVLVGMEAHICVYQTALGLLETGYQVHAVSDAIAARLPENMAVGLSLLESAGCIMTSTEAVLFQLLERAGSDAFKKLQKLIL